MKSHSEYTRWNEISPTDYSRFSESVVQDLEQMHNALRQVMTKLSLPELPPLQSINSRDEGTPPKDDNPSNTSNHLAVSQDEFRGPSCDNSPKATPEDEGLPYVPIHSLYTLTKLSALRSPDNPEAQRGNVINDYSRRGLIDGRIVRLPTVVVRPGKPSAAASSLASGIVRESLQGIPNTLPVPRSTPIWICSPAIVVKNLIMMKDIPAEKFGHSRIVNLPGRTVSVQDILDAVEKVGGKEALGYVKEEADEAAYKIVKGWAPWFDDSRAMSLGLHADGELVDAVKAFQDRLKAK